VKKQNTIKIKDIIAELESWAPPGLQESYDNSGLLIGDRDKIATGAILCLDCTEEVIMEAKKKRVNLVIAHHPIIFSGLKSITGKTYVEKTVLAAIKHDIAIYAIHTNLDNTISGVNSAICNKVGLVNTSILQPKKGVLRKLSTFTPIASGDKIREALFEAGGGNIGNYDQCSYTVTGHGTFRGNEQSNPTIGKKNIRHLEEEEKIEIIYESHLEQAIVNALIKAHPYEEVAYDLYNLENQNQSTGSGMIGQLSKALSTKEFLKMLKINMKAEIIRHTTPLKKKIKRVAVCGGSGSFLLGKAMAAGADAFVTADFKYHQFFDAENRILVADIGHFESEQFTGVLVMDQLREKFPTFALHLTEIDTNPVYYY
jgi:dinuclear metal center YbgI/SA1388 family protein